MQIKKGRQSAPQKVPTVNGSTFNYKSHYSLWGLQMRIIKHNRELYFYYNLILSVRYLLHLLLLFHAINSQIINFRFNYITDWTIR